MARNERKKQEKADSRLRLKIHAGSSFPMILMAVIVGVVAARNMSEGASGNVVCPEGRGAFAGAGV